MIYDYDQLWQEIADHYHGGPDSIHGPSHWRRVLENGLAIAKTSGANTDIVRLFALFHDCQRENDGHDPGHGLRGAEFSKLYRGKAFDLSDDDFDLLFYACQWHTDEIHHDDPTIGTCWDSDRLDLTRVYMTPDSNYLNTAAAILAARAGSTDVLFD